MHAIRGPGELLGELSAIDGEPRSATVIALDEVEALVLTAPAFKAFLTERPDAMLLLVRMLSRRLRAAARRDVELVAYDTLGRLSARLLELADRFGEPDDDGAGIVVRVSQEDLAAMSGASRQAVEKGLKALRACGWIRTGRRRIVIVDGEALRRRSS